VPAADLRVGLFPLPDVVFFPETLLPLHVFEPRYRRLVADALAADGRLAVVKLRPGWEKNYEGRPPVHAVAGLGEIVQAESLADGRYNILLYGLARIRIEGEEEAPDLPYRVARATRLQPSGGVPTTREGESPLTALRQTHIKLLHALGQAQPDVVGRVTVAGADSGGTIDRIVSSVIPDATLRQRALETVDVDQRLQLAEKALADLLTFVGGASGDDDDADE
jgi:Lon protease-like protein